MAVCGWAAAGPASRLLRRLLGQFLEFLLHLLGVLGVQLRLARDAALRSKQSLSEDVGRGGAIAGMEGSR